MPLFPIFALFLAAADVIPGTQPEAITADQAQLISWGIFAVIFSTLLNVIALVFAGIKALRRNPPLHETFATKSELRDLSSRVDNKEKDLAEIFRELRTISNALGRVEGLERLIEANQESSSERFAEIREQLRTINQRLSD